MSTDRPAPAPVFPPVREVPRLLRRLVDDAAVFPPGNAPVDEALTAHAGHRAAWYADLVGPLLLPLSTLETLSDVALPELGVVGDTGVAAARAALRSPQPGWRQVEVAVAKRGEDPQPGLRELLADGAAEGDLDLYVELPLTTGLMAALDTLAEHRASGARVAAKFRTGGLAAELFPTPMELAAVIRACFDRDLPFKLTAGLHHAVRHTDPQTGFTHHGFLNVLAACLATADGAEVADTTRLLATVDPAPLVEAVRPRLFDERPLWIAYGSCSVAEPLEDLLGLGLLDAGDREAQG